ncbi:uncharacterized protein ACIQIH_006484 isoform 3-T3 [Cyanocitta cristata]
MGRERQSVPILSEFFSRTTGPMFMSVAQERFTLSVDTLSLEPTKRKWYSVWIPRTWSLAGCNAVRSPAAVCFSAGRMRKPGLLRRKMRRCGRMETAATKGWGRHRSRTGKPT